MWSKKAIPVSILLLPIPSKLRSILILVSLVFLSMLPKRSVDFRKTRRGAKGVIAMQISERNGQLIGAAQVTDEDELMLISDKGMLVRTKVSEVNVIGRNTQGVTVIRLKGSEKLISIAPISEEFIGDE